MGLPLCLITNASGGYSRPGAARMSMREVTAFKWPAANVKLKGDSRQQRKEKIRHSSGEDIREIVFMNPTHIAPSLRKRLRTCLTAHAADIADLRLYQTSATHRSAPTVRLGQRPRHRLLVSLFTYRHGTGPRPRYIIACTPTPRLRCYVSLTVATVTLSSRSQR